MMDGLISRQAAIDALILLHDHSDMPEDWHEGVSDAVTCLFRVPYVRPERKKGKWVKARGSWCTPGGDPVWECSLCGKGVHVYGIEHGTYGSDIADGQWIACPNCGAEMVGEDT